MIISPLATYTKVTSNKSPRYMSIEAIIPHFMADGGAFTGAGCADYFHLMGQTGQRQCSSSYCIGGGGDIACSVPEEYRPWTSSSEWADQRAVTIEVSSINNATGEVTKEAWKSLVALCVDICQRNGIKGLTYTGNTANSNLWEHRFFSSTNCPGEYLHRNMMRLADEVNAALKGAQTPKTLGWKLEDGKWHYYNEYGIVWSEWVDKDGSKAYVKSNTCAAQSEWVLIDGSWYYFGADGIVKRGWLSLDGQWYYCKSDFKMAKSEWIWSGTYGAWYYFNERGEMQRSRWIQDEGRWYYVKSNGKMAAGEWVKDNGKYYYCYGDGHMAVSEEVDGYEVNARGERMAP